MIKKTLQICIHSIGRGNVALVIIYYPLKWNFEWNVLGGGLKLFNTVLYKSGYCSDNLMKYQS